MKKAEVVVIGAGVIGCSIAWHLAAAGVRGIVVVDRAPAIGGGSTAFATGGFRCQFGSESNIRLSLLSRQKLLRFEEETGVDPGYVETGYLFLADSSKQLDQLESLVQLQNRLDVPSRIVDAGEVAAINPAVSADAHAGGSFCPIDGTIRPLEILRGYYEACRRAGVEFLFEDEPLQFSLAEGRIERMTTRRETIVAGAYVNAAGAWAREVAALAEVDLPVEPLRRFVLPTVATDVLPANMPLTIFLRDGFHFRVRDGRVLLLWPDMPESDRTSTIVPPEWIDRVVQLTNERIPALRDVAVDRNAAWGGLYEISPDHHVILGADEQVANFFFTNGSSGHGVMHSPAIGQLTAELIRGVTPSIDVGPLAISRFRAENPIIAPHLL
jgi:sarcosine oxidase subunit beta